MAPHGTWVDYTTCISASYPGTTVQRPDLIDQSAQELALELAHEADTGAPQQRATLHLASFTVQVDEPPELSTSVPPLVVSRLESLGPKNTLQQREDILKLVSPASMRV